MEEDVLNKLLYRLSMHKRSGKHEFVHLLLTDDYFHDNRDLFEIVSL